MEATGARKKTEASGEMRTELDAVTRHVARFQLLHNASQRPHGRWFWRETSDPQKDGHVGGSCYPRTRGRYGSVWLIVSQSGRGGVKWGHTRWG